MLIRVAVSKTWGHRVKVSAVLLQIEAKQEKTKPWLTYLFTCSNPLLWVAYREMGFTVTFSHMNIIMLCSAPFIALPRPLSWLPSSLNSSSLLLPYHMHSIIPLLLLYFLHSPFCFHGAHTHTHACTPARTQESRFLIIF